MRPQRLGQRKNLMRRKVGINRKKTYGKSYNRAYNAAYNKGFNDGYTKGLEDGILDKKEKE